MVDNVAVTPGAGATIATDDVAGVQYQRVKVDLGGDGAASPLLRGQQSTANSLPVTLPSDQGVLAVTVSGTVDTELTTADLDTGVGSDSRAVVGLVRAESGGGVLVGSANPLPVSGTVTANLAAGTNNIGDVDILTIAAGDNNIGNVDIVTMPNVTLAAGTNTNEVVGDAAHDAAVAGNPVRIAGRAANADYTAVANGDTADLLCDLNGKQIVMPYALPETFVVGVTAAITGTADTAVIAAAGAGVRNYVNSLTVTNSHATVGTVVELKDGTTVIHRAYAAPAGGGFTVQFPTPLRGTANTAINAACLTTGSNVYVSASGFKAP